MARSANGTRRPTLGLARRAAALEDDPLTRRRQLVADLCRLLGARYEKALRHDGSPLPPRVAQTLEHLLRGDSEKQIARYLGVSRNTVHVYVTMLYRHFDVCTRAELLARFVRRPNAVSPV